eukprot:scaffold13537_cov77-Skeletonema_dohrnii-CCMP3373.AAC.2
MDAQIQLKSTRFAVRRINCILLLVDNVGEEEEDYVALIHRESHSRKNDVALAAAVSKQKSSTSNSGSNRGTSPQISAAARGGPSIQRVTGQCKAAPATRKRKSSEKYLR